MTIDKAVVAGLAGEKISRLATGTKKVSAGRSAIAAGAGGLVGGALAGSVTVAASAVGATALATAAAPLVIPLAVASGAVALIRSCWD